MGSVIGFTGGVMRGRYLAVLLVCIILGGICHGEEGVAAVLPVPADMVYIRGGDFMMGSPEGEPRRIRNEVLHPVRVSAFYLGKREVSRAEYAAVTGVDIYGERYRLRNPRRDDDVEFKRDLRYPDEAVRHVSWYEAVEYCNKRSEAEGLRAAYRITIRDGEEPEVE
jgi:formylglycine-generating enzyme required for sulfatase activity